MNFTNFYVKTQNRLKDSLLSLWATGDAAMQQYFSTILDKEELMAEPVFQTAFPWEPSKLQFAQCNHIFSASFINALDAVKNKEYRFPRDRKPYKHQVESWDVLINQNKSIAVTTGTGSGKTECFMLPVLHDIFTNCRHSSGINAIFLYPLNALIGSQKKRVDAWCGALGGIKYAVYNGNTDENPPATRKIHLSSPELTSRKQIRDTPPQILFTNPSMLEYVLVRNKDVNLLKNSKGSLRWILLDEAHTLTGSSAAEMSLLIRRIADAFAVDMKQLRFAITSATVGQGEESRIRLKHFMANLCGINEDNIKVITGERVLSQELEPPSTSAKQPVDELSSSTPESLKEVQQLRKDILSEGALTLSDIGKRFCSAPIIEQLKIVDQLSERKMNGYSIFPVRAHFFARGIGGVYVCANPACEEHKSIKPLAALGTMTTIAAGVCKCKSPLFELVACRSCGNQLMEAERYIDKDADETIRQVSVVAQDVFSPESPDETDEEDDIPSQGKFYFTKKTNGIKFVTGVIPFSLSDEAKIIYGGEPFVHHEYCQCPHCGATINNPIHFRLSSAFINRILADIILEETPEDETQKQGMLWRGHKYISFTDSRQGTAKISALINQDNEATWVRSQVYHKLCERQKEWKELNPEISKDDLKAMISELEAQLALTTFPALRTSTQKEIANYKAQLTGSSGSTAPVSLSWVALREHLILLSEFNTLFEGNNPHDSNPNARSHYLNAILYDQFARRLPLERSLENLGMVSLIYPKLRDVTLPSVAESLGIKLEEWKSLLKIALDYNIRYPFHFFLSPEIEPYTTKPMRSLHIYDPNPEPVNVRKWATFKRTNIRQNRLALLICAGLGLHEREDIDADIEFSINELMERIWGTVKKVLQRDSGGFKLKLEEDLQFQLTKTLWLCPVKKRLIDIEFRGYSPWMKGNLTSDNICHYKIEKSIEFPAFPYPYNLDDEKNISIDRTREWLEQRAQPLKEAGVWNNLHEQIILNRPLYFSGEHSAQQNDRRLKELENEFEKGTINILNCSTTMEMGVDIGGISAVVMNNVPPSPANYLQRAGRAGRRAEAKSLAFTICSPNPVGLNAMANPMWALHHPIAPPFVSFRSKMVAERHVNAFFLGKFVQTDAVKGLNVKDDIQSFFFKENSLALQFSTWFQNNDVFQYESALKTIVNKTPLGEKSFAFLLTATASAFQKLCDKAANRNNGFDEKLQQLAEEFGDASPAYKAVSFQKSQFGEKNAFVYLAEEGFMPSAGLPTGIVEFDTLNIDDLRNKRRNKSKPSYFITRALSEFAPGNQIVIDGKSFKSEGIILKSDRGTQAEREIIQSCTHCGYQRIKEVGKDEDIDKCPHCEHNTFVGINFKNQSRGKFTEMIQPAGFAVDIYETPSRKINEASSVQYVDPLLLNIKVWQNESAALYDARESEGNAEILFYNVGHGNGYAVCLHCGRTAFNEEQLAGHKRLRGGKNNDNEKNAVCSGNDASLAIRSNVILGGRFRTDFCEIRFKDETNVFSKNESLLYSLGAVLSKELAHYLAVDEREIDFGIKRYDRFSSVFIFDTAKGGAGYAPQFTLYADEIFKLAKEKLSRCNCDKACIRCLIDRKTQWHIDKLDRELAVSWLELVTNLQVPTVFLEDYPNLKTVAGSVKDEIGRMSYANKIRVIWLFGSTDVDSWEVEKLQFLNKLRNKFKVHFVLSNGNSAMTTQDKITLIQLKEWAEIWQLQSPPHTTLKTVCKIETDDGKVVEYLSEDFEQTFNENWGSVTKGLLYKNSEGSLSKVKMFDISVDEQSVFVKSIEPNNSIQSNEIGDLLLKKLNGSLDLKSLMQGEPFNIEYSDRYLNSPLSCILLVQFIDRLKNRLDFDISSFKFKGQSFTEHRPLRLLQHNFANPTDRNIALLRLAQELNIPNSEAVTEDLPHYRYFEFKSDNLKITIRPDAGIAYGWFFDGSAYNKLFNNRTNARDVFAIKNEKQELLFTVSIEKNSKRLN